MNKQDIDLYLNRISKAQTDSEKLAITKDFLTLINGSVVFADSNREVLSYKNSKDLMNYLVETGAVSILNEIGAAHIPDLSRMVGVIVRKSDAPNKEIESEKINSYVEKLLSSADILPENPTVEELQVVGGLIIKSVGDSIRNGTPISEKMDKMTKRFFSKLPNPTDFRHTYLYERIIVAKMQEREDVRNLIPKLTLEEYREVLGYYDEANCIYDFDDTLNEYLSFYANSGEIDYDEINDLFINLKSKFDNGRLINSHTYTSYFMNTDTRENIAFLYSRRSTMMRDVLARIFENDGQDVRTTETEREYFELFYLPNKNRNENGEVTYSYEGEFEDMLKFLYNHGGEEWTDVARYSIRLKNLFNAENKPKEPFLAKVYNHINSLDLYGLLKENLNPEVLKEPEIGDPRYAKEMLSLPSIRDKNIERIDAADTALSLMLEVDYTRGITEFYNQQNINSYIQYGRNIYDSKASRKLIELYVDGNNPSAEEIIRQVVHEITSKPDFNIFDEGEISELLQFGYTKRTVFGKDILSSVLNNLSKNPKYQISEEQAQNNVDEFIKNVGTNPIGIEQESEFDNFLNSLAKLRMFHGNGIMPEKAVEFLISQSLRPDSIINLKNDKYGKVPERAIEDLGKIDILKRVPGKDLIDIYVTRDYLNKAIVDGKQNRNKRSVAIKRDSIKRLANGNFDAINNVFHENTHVIQHNRFKVSSKNYAEYLMKKEVLIMASDREYYNQNYKLIFEEIEAREEANQLTADYIGNIISQNQIPYIADTLKQSVNDSLVQRFEQLKNLYYRDAARESQLYRTGINKVDRDGQTRNINEIFDRRFRGGEIDFYHFMMTEPMLVYEYNPDKSRKNFPEQIIAAANTTSLDKDKFDFIKSIINNSGTAKDANAYQTLAAINYLIDSRGVNNRNKSEFIAQVVGPNLPDIIENYGKYCFAYLKSGQLPTEEMIQTYLVVQNVMKKINDEPDGEWKKGFRVENGNGRNSLELMGRYCEVMQCYDIDKKTSLKPSEVSRGNNQGFGTVVKSVVSSAKKIWGYHNISVVKAGVEGKRTLQRVEDNLEKSKQKSTDEIK